MCTRGVDSGGAALAGGGKTMTPMPQPTPWRRRTQRGAAALSSPAARRRQRGSDTSRARSSGRAAWYRLLELEYDLFLLREIFLLGSCNVYSIVERCVCWIAIHVSLYICRVCVETAAWQVHPLIRGFVAHCGWAIKPHSLV